ncbi:uncharacterized protein LOC108678236 [Hyalella azteca]|uniref:Uncharacterized protein LOC108678236 n=1 Tax=Hyalella azteca TaxID=294128 RepID=A0A8B7PA78_HYAAZ|nr:uncharacterized protein LOC108678236 [Hyalella azteca]
MLLLWFFLILETACSTTVPTSKILIRHPAYGSCLRTAVGVQFRSYRTGGVKFLRKVVSKTDFECMASVAVKFGTTDFSECSKLAASSGWNSFFFDDQSECWASYFSLAEATEVCTGEGVVVYFSSVKLSHFTVPSPTITEFSVTDSILGKSFTVNFRGPCSAYIK